MWRHLEALVVNTEPTVLENIVDFLEHAEAVCLLVYAIESRTEQLVRFLYAHPHLLLLGDDTKKHASVLHCAAAHGRIAVVQWVLRHRSMRIHREAVGWDPAMIRPFRPQESETTKTKKTKEMDTKKTTVPRLSAMAWVNRNVPYLFPAEVMYEAAKQGDRDVVAWLHTTARYESYKAMEFAASRGHLEIVQWLYDHESSAIKTAKTMTDTQLYMLVPLDGALDVVNWIAVFVKGKYFREAFATRNGLVGAYDQRDDGIQWDDASDRDVKFSSRLYKAIDVAAAQGDLDLIKKLHADKKWQCTPQAMDGAARRGHLEVVKWLHANRRKGCTSNAIAAAAGNGHFDVVQWLHANRFEGCRSYAMDVTATHGHLEILQWLYIEYPRFTCSSAFIPCVAANNHKHVLHWLHEEKGMQFDIRTVEAAITEGHFELVQWLLKRAPHLAKELTSSTVAKAARSGNVEMTRWLVQDRGLWSPRALVNAARAGNLELVQWLHRTGNQPNDLVDDDALFEVGKQRRLDIVRWLLENHLGTPLFSSSQKPLLALFASTPKTVGAGFGTLAPPTHGKLFAWDLHTKDNPSWIRKYTRLALSYCPEAAISIEWMTTLAAQRGDLPILQYLAAGGHAEVYTKQAWSAILTYTKAGDVLQWFRTTSPRSFEDAGMIEWGTKFKLFTFLESFFMRENREARFQSHAFGTLLTTACRHGHVDVLQWALGKVEAFFPRRPSSGEVVRDRFWSVVSWEKCILDAAMYGQLDVLLWLHEEHPPLFLCCSEGYLQQLAIAAAGSGQLQVLTWLHDAFMKGSFQIPHAALDEALANKHADVVQWIVRHRCDGDDDVVPTQRDQEVQACVAAEFVESEMDGFIPTRISYVLPPPTIYCACLPPTANPKSTG